MTKVWYDIFIKIITLKHKLFDHPLYTGMPQSGLSTVVEQAALSFVCSGASKTGFLRMRLILWVYLLTLIKNQIIWFWSNMRLSMPHYQLPPILIALQPIDLIKLSSIRSIHLYQVNVTLHFYEWTGATFLTRFVWATSAVPQHLQSLFNGATLNIGNLNHYYNGKNWCHNLNPTKNTFCFSNRIIRLAEIDTSEGG